MKAPVAAGLVITACALAAYAQPLSQETLALDRWLVAQLKSAGVPRHFGSETFAATGLPTGAPGWFGSLITGAFASISPLAVSLVNAILCALVLCALYALCARSGPLVALVATALAAVCMLDGFASGTLGYELAAALAFVTLIRRGHTNASLLAIAVAIVWCNIAVSGLIAGPFALAVTIGVLVQERGTSWKLRRLVAITFGSLGAALCSPGGFAYASEALTHLGFFDEKIEALTVWNPTSRPRALLFGFAPLLVVSAWIGWRRTARLSDTLLASTAVLAGLTNVNMLPIAAVVVALILAEAAGEVRWDDRLDARPRLIAGASALAAIVVAVTAIVRPAEQDRHIGDNLTALGAERVHHLFCSVPAWCNLALGGPIAVYMDGRVTSYPAGIRQTATEIAAAQKSWRATLDRLHADAVMTPDDRALATLLDADPNWRRIPSEGAVAVFVRNG